MKPGVCMRKKLFYYGLVLLTAYLMSYLIIDLRVVNALITLTLLFCLVCILFIKLIKYRNIIIKLTLIFILGVGCFAQEYIKYINAEDYFNTNYNEYSGEIIDIRLKEDNYYEALIKPEGTKLKVLGYFKAEDNLGNIIGNRYIFKGKVNIPDEARNPGCFNYRLYLKSKGICRIQQIDSMAIIDRGKGINKLRGYILNKREGFLRIYKDNGMVNALLFGEKAYLNEDVYERFKLNGIAHILAVSGLHIGIIYALFLWLIRGSKNKLYGLIFIVFLLAYGIMTMFSPSCVRAIFMVIISMGAFYYDRRFDSLSALSFTFIVFTSYNPYVIFNIGFKFSFIAVLGICFIMPRIKPYLGSFFSTIIAAQITIIPVIAYELNYICLMSFFSNILMIPLVGILVPILIVHLCIYLLTGFKLLILAKIVISITDILIYINDYIYQFNIFIMDNKGFNLSILFLYYSIIFFLFSETYLIFRNRKRNKEILAFYLIISLLALNIYSYSKNDYLDYEMVFIDVGQGDAIHIRDDKYDILIDGGGHYKKNIGEDVLKVYLLKNRVNDLDLAIPTHLHMDHFKGIYELNDVYDIKSIMAFYGYEGHTEHDIFDKYLKVGDVITFSEKLDIEILWPILSKNEAFDIDDENIVNMVLKVKYDNVSIIITGDLLKEGEKRMVEYYKGTDKLNCDILKIGHHGSKSSTTDEFLNATSPKVAIIQVGKNNYGHPSNMVIEKLIKNDIMVFRNDLDGAIGVDINDSKFSIHKMIKED